MAFRVHLEQESLPLISLLCGLYIPNHGLISIDGNNYADIDTNYLRSRLEIMSQNAFLLTGTVIDNITICEPTSTLDEVHEAAALAGASEFIERFPNRFHTDIGEKGFRLSGGQRQRLALGQGVDKKGSNLNFR